MVKSTGLIFQDFSIAGILKQWEWQQYFSLEKPCLRGNERECNLLNTSCENCYDNYQRWVDANKPGFAGRKSETRRTRGLDEINENPDDWALIVTDENDTSINKYASFSNNGKITTITCPWGVVGDEIYVKEAYAKVTTGDIEDDVTLQLDSYPIYLYKADDFNSDIEKWKSPMFMPKAASRITLEITGIKIERLQDITEEGAMREGIYQIEGGMWLSNGGKSIKDTCRGSEPQFAYKMMWWLLHGQESWDKNIFVWVIQFKVKSVKP